MRITKGYKLDEHFVVVLWGWYPEDGRAVFGRLRRNITTLHTTYADAQASIGALLEGADRGTYATIERRYS